MSAPPPRWYGPARPGCWYRRPPHRQRLRAALARDVATLLAVPATHVVVVDDPIRFYGGVPGQLITVEDADDPDVVLRFLPETGNTGTGGGAYLLLDACPGCTRVMPAWGARTLDRELEVTADSRVAEPNT